MCVHLPCVQSIWVYGKLVLAAGNAHLNMEVCVECTAQPVLCCNVDSESQHSALAYTHWCKNETCTFVSSSGRPRVLQPPYHTYMSRRWIQRCLVHAAGYPRQLHPVLIAHIRTGADLNVLPVAQKTHAVA
jgi:hypothetical protein